MSERLKRTVQWEQYSRKKQRNSTPPHDAETESGSLSIPPNDELASGALQATVNQAASEGFPSPAKTPTEHISTPDDLIHPAPSTSQGRIDRVVSASSTPPIVHAPQSILEGAKDFKIENSVLTNVQGNAVIFRFDSGSPPSEEFKSVLVKHMAGIVTVRDLDKIEKRTLTQAIRDLPRAEAAYDDYVCGNRRRVACFEGTRQALLEEIAQCVASSDGARAYLLFGIAGIGKSTVAETVSKRADALLVLGASFFFSRDEADRRNARRFFTTIAFQLCAYDPDFAQAIGMALTTERGAAATSKDPQRQLEVLILEPLQAIAVSRSLPTVIVVDALDECDVEDGPKVLMGLDKLVQELPFFKVILTTRPQPHLQDLLDLLGTHQTFRMEDIEGKVVESDIRRYLEYSLSPDQVHTRLPRLRRRWAANEEEIDSLVRATGVLFIIASTAVLYILDKAGCNPGSRMKMLQEELGRNRTPFNTLNDFYTVILRSALPPSCERDIVERYQAVVGTIVLLEDPLPVDALANLIDMPEDDIHYVLDDLQSVISLGNNGVPLVYHKSFPDYITDDQRCRDSDLRVAPRDHHTRLAICCLRITNRHLKRNILDLGGPAQYFDNKEALKEEKLSMDDVQRAIPPELQYACVYWANHVVQADLQDGHLAAEFKTFVEKHLLHWLEALSWIRKFGIAYPSVYAVLKCQIMDSDVCQIFPDALRFVSMYYVKIEQSALYIYHSALPFTPTESLLYKNYQKEILLCRVIGGPAQWDVLISKNQHGGHDLFSFIHHIAFTKDSSQFASWIEDTVKLWDATNGTPLGSSNCRICEFAGDVFAAAKGCLVTIHSVSTNASIVSFNHPAEVVTMAISPDASWLAAGLESCIVRIWDVATRVLIADLDGIDCSELEFSPSGYMLVFTECTISLWNGAVLVGLDHGAEVPVTRTFSGDGTRLATITHGDHHEYILRLWNGENGEFIALARVTAYQPLAVSADGSLVATAGDKEVQLWSGDSLALVDTIPSQSVGSLAFSGDTLAISSFNTVTLYGVKNCASIAMLPGHCVDTASLAFSPDGRRLAAGGINGIVHLWDLSTTRVSALTPKQQSSPVTALALSLDCSRLASGRKDGSVELWDSGHMTEPITCHKLHSDRIGTLAFSPDGNQLASGSRDRKVRFWGGSDGMPIGILEPSFPNELTCLALSSSLLAAATEEAITLWDHASLHLIHTFHTFERGGNLLSFSLDGFVLAAIYRNYLSVLDTKNFIVARRFTLNDGWIVTLFVSPDGSQIATGSTSGFIFFDISNKTVTRNPENGDLVPHLNGIPILPGWNWISGWFSSRCTCVPVLNIPPDFEMQSFASQSSMFALGCKDGRILLIQPPVSY